MADSRCWTSAPSWRWASPGCSGTLDDGFTTLCRVCRLNLPKADRKGPAFPQTVLGLKLRLGEISLLRWKSSPLVLGQVGCLPRRLLFPPSTFKWQVFQNREQWNRYATSPHILDPLLCVPTVLQCQHPVPANLCCSDLPGTCCACSGRWRFVMLLPVVQPLSRPRGAAPWQEGRSSFSFSRRGRLFVHVSAWH